MRKSTKVGALLIPLVVAGGFTVQAPVPSAYAAVREFVMGADLGLLPEMEAAGCAFYENETAKDAVEILADAGVNMGRVRLWVNPYSASGQPYGGGTNDLENTIALAQRMKNAGMSIMLDIHYSDWWADPAHQKKPKAWADLSFSALNIQVHDYTQSAITSMKNAGVLPDMVQIGNEISGGMLYPDGSTNDFAKLGTLLNSAIGGLNDALAPSDVVETIIHLDNGGQNSLYRWFFDNITAAGVTDFDIIGLSYYPFWHGTVAGLTSNVNDISQRYNKDVMIVEAATAWTPSDYDQGNVVGSAEIVTSGYPGTVAGQTEYLRDMVTIMKNVPYDRGRGVVWWEPTWRGCPTAVPWGNSNGVAYGGNAGTPTNNWDNLTLFDWSGRPLSTVEVISETTTTNSVVNPGFEANGATNTPNNWSVWTQNSADYNAIYTEGSALSGNYKMTHWKATAYEASMWQTVTVPNGHYRVSAWVRSGGGQNASYMWVKYYGGSEVRRNLPVGIDNWQLMTIEVAVTAGSLEMGFYSNANAGNWINVDSVRVTPSQ